MKRLVSSILLTAILTLVLNLIIVNQIDESVTYNQNITDAQIKEYLYHVELSIENSIVDVQRNLVFLSQVSSFKEYVESGGEPTPESFLSLGEIHPEYAQIRYIDKEGYEQIRINNSDGQTSVIPAAELQYKGEREYFLNTIALEEGTMFISRLDFNIENDEIVVPLEPVIRFSYPIYVNDEVEGMLIINYDGIKFLDILQQNVEHFDFTNIFQESSFFKDIQCMS